MTQPRISHRTIEALEDYLVANSELRKIRSECEAADIHEKEGFQPPSSGQRRGLFQSYLASLDLTNPEDERKLLVIFASVLSGLEERLHLIMVDSPDARPPKELDQPFRMLVNRLRADGFLYQEGKITSAVQTPSTSYLRDIAERLDAPNLWKQIQRMEASVDADPALAVGTAKELLETTCKTILIERGVSLNSKWEVMDLVTEARKALDLVPTSVSDSARAADTLRRMIGCLVTVAEAIRDLRNLHGTGHGPEARSKTLDARHARFAVGAAATVAAFLLETHEAQPVPRPTTPF
jgi:abortive infection Abi-like protein